MNISFEIAGDSVGVNDLVEAVKPTGVVTRVGITMTLGKHGPRPALMAIFDAPPQSNVEFLTEELLERLKLAGIEVDHG